MKTKKRFLSLFLSAVMALSLLPSAAFAVEAPETGEQPTVAVSDDAQTQAGSPGSDVLVASDADEAEGEVTTKDPTDSTGETVTPEITWSRTKELKYSQTGLGELYAGAKSNYENIDGSSGRPTSAYFEWSWSNISKLKTSLTGDANVWDFGTSNQYTNTTPSKPDLGIAFDSTTDTAGTAATWNNRVREAVTVYDDRGNSKSYKKGQFDDFSDSTSQGRVNDKSYTVRKISGTFVWPEGYDLSDNIELVSVNDAKYQKLYDYINKDASVKQSFGGKKVLAINDDVYAFIYKDGDTPTSSNHMDYMAFWTGTAGKGVWSATTGQAYTQYWGSTWNMMTAPATYGGEYAVRAFQGVVPNMDTSALSWDSGSPNNPTRKTVYDVGVAAGALKQSDGWYSFMDGNSLSTVLNNKYENQKLDGEKFHIDFYCFDTDKVGGMDKLKLQMTKATSDEVNVTVRYWLDSVEATTDRNYLGSTTMTNQEIGDNITLANGTDVNQLNHKRAAAITLNNGKDVEPGVQQNPVPFTVTDDSSRNIIDVVYQSNNEIRTVAYTYDFGVKNSYADLLKDAGVQNRDSVTVTVPDDYASYVHYDKNTDTISYTPQSINIQESVLLTLTRTVNRKTELMYLRVYFLPETNVLYEETFMDDSEDVSAWESVGTNDSSTEATDNGSGSVYGYTSAYDKTSNHTFSNGGAYQVHFDLQGDTTSMYSASDKVFTFKGTGFDLISECGTNTGMLIVGIKDVETDKTVKGYIVDTYFSGDVGDAEVGSIISGKDITAYQIPVVRAMGLDYGKYQVTVRGYFTSSAGAAVKSNSNIAQTQSAAVSEKELAKSILRDAGMGEYSKNVELSYMDDNSVLNGGTGVAATASAKDNAIARTASATTTTASASVYIDGFRIYQPRHNNESGYVEQEKNLTYGSVYDYLTANDDPYKYIDSSAVYVETDGDTAGISEAIIKNYKQKGPENEVYLTIGNFVGFALKGYEDGQTVMVSAKSINQGANATLSAIKPSGDDSETTVVKELEQCGTEMYYDVSQYVFQMKGTYYLILGNDGSDEQSVLSISGIKLPKDTTSFSSAETSNAIAKVVSLAYQEDSTFVPKYFKVSAKNSVKAGKSTTIKATASTTVDHIAIYTNAKCTKPVNRKTKAIHPDNKKAVRRGTAKRYTFHASVKIAKKQKYSFYVVAYDKNGNASDPVKVSITGKR